METYADAVEQLTSAQAGGFDFKDEQALKLVVEGARKLAAESHWIKAEPELGPTVAEQAAYELPENVVRLFDLAIDDAPYTRRDVRTGWDVKSGRSVSAGEGGVFYERFSADGSEKSFELTPAPDESGLAIASLCSVYPATVASGDTLPFPFKYRRAIVNYAKAIGYQDIDENQAVAQGYFERADAEAEGLRLFANARTGSGPFKIPVAGHRRR